MKNKKLIAARIIMTLLSLGAICFIFSNSLMNADDSQGMSDGVMDSINRWLCSLNINIVLDEVIIRKTAHFTEFAVLGALLCATAYLYLKKRPRSLLTAFGLGALTGISDELLQTTSTGRSCEVRDMLIDSSGALLGALAAILIITIIIRIKNKRKTKLITEGENNG